MPYVVLLAGALVVGGCTVGDDPAPPVTGSPGSSQVTSSSSRGTTTPTSGASSATAGAENPLIPAAARLATEAGAEAFTSYFFQQVNASYATADAKLMEPLVQTTCKTCEGFVETVRTLARDGQHYAGDFATPTLVTIATFDSPKAKTFVATQTPRHTVVDAAGTIVDTIEASVLNVTVLLSFDGQWRVSEIKTAA